jgi:hypothetical protein
MQDVKSVRAGDLEGLGEVLQSIAFERIRDKIAASKRKVL